MSCDPFSVIGYHGTLLNRARSIQKEGFRESKKPIEWLGFGVYFFAARADAEYWARKEFRRCKENRSSPTLIVVDLKMAQDGLLDLDLPSVKDAFEAELASMYDSMFGGAGTGAPRFKDERECRCFWCNCYMQAHPELKVIALSFPLESFDRFGLPAMRRQLCAVRRDCICMPPKKVEVLS